jgi:hypothetical protein
MRKLARELQMGMALVPLQSMASSFLMIEKENGANIVSIAEFRGPGVHHNFDDSDSGYDVDMDQKSKPFGANQRGELEECG